MFSSTAAVEDELPTHAFEGPRRLHKMWWPYVWKLTSVFYVLYAEGLYRQTPTMQRHHRGNRNVCSSSVMYDTVVENIHLHILFKTVASCFARMSLNDFGERVKEEENCVPTRKNLNKLTLYNIMLFCRQWHAD